MPRRDNLAFLDCYRIAPPKDANHQSTEQCRGCNAPASVGFVYPETDDVIWLCRVHANP